MARMAEPRNTIKRNKWAVNTFNAWAISRNNQRGNTEKVRSLDVMDSKELSYWMCKFVCEVRKQDGKEYPPRSLLSLCMGLQGNIRVERKLKLDILKNPEFENFRQVLDGRMKSLTRDDYRATKRQAEVFTTDQEDRFWNRKLLGDHNPKVLLRTRLYLNGKHFALRSGAEHRALRYLNSRITLRKDGDIEVLEYREDYSKTNQGGLRHIRVHQKSARIYASADPSRCPIRLYKLYMSLCPSTGRDGAFYLSPLYKPHPHVWYSRQAVGHNTLQKLIPELCKEAGLSGHYTNHSLRATAATTLYRAGVDEQLIMSQTGHRSVSGVRSYKRTSEEQKMAISNILTDGRGSVASERSTGSCDQSETEMEVSTFGGKRPRRDEENAEASDEEPIAKYTFVNCTVDITGTK